MRKIVYGVAISLDGYIARSDGSVDFLFMPADYSMAAFFKRIDTAVMGRKTYEMGLKLGGGSISSPGMKCYVFSRTLETGNRNGVTIVRDSPTEFVATVRKKKGKDVWLMGGGVFARELLREHLVDELYLGVVPVLIGEGIPAFPATFPQGDFKLVENKTYSRGMIALHYQRKRVTRRR